MIGRIALKHILHYVKWMASGSSVYEAGHPKPVLCDNLEGMTSCDEEKVGGRFKREGTCVYLMPIHGDVWHKPSQYCEVIIL